LVAPPSRRLSFERLARTYAVRIRARLHGVPQIEPTSIRLQALGKTQRLKASS